MKSRLKGDKITWGLVLKIIDGYIVLNVGLSRAKICISLYFIIYQLIQELF